MVDSLRYFEWDYDKRIVKEYQRIGECNGCGACCKAMISFRASSRVDLPPDVRMETDPDPREGGDGTTGQGVWAEVHLLDGRRKFFQVYEILPGTTQCSQLTDDNRCAMHFNKLLICSGWPFNPSHVAPFSECSYSFVEVERWNMDKTETNQSTSNGDQ